MNDNMCFRCKHTKLYDDLMKAAYIIIGYPTDNEEHKYLCPECADCECINKPNFMKVRLQPPKGRII